VAENLPAIRQAWALLNEADRQGAAAHAPDVLAEATKAGRKLTTSLLTYLKGQPWRIAAQAKREAEGRALPEAGEAVRFQNWSRHWWALIIARAAKGLANGFIVSQAARDRAGQWGCKAGDFGPFAPEAMRQLRADTTAGRAWLDWIEAGGGIPGHVAAGQRCHLDITNPERLWLFAPCETPDGLKDWIMQHQAEAAAQ
jgi:hypothetical protein